VISTGDDPDAGVVTQATVTFINRDTNAIIAEHIPVTLLDPTDLTTGTASYDWIVDLSNQDAESYTIGVIVNGYYRRDSAQDNTVVTVSKPLQNFITGGGYLINQSSTGLYAGDQGEKTNFGFNVKFNKQLTNIQGKVNIIIRQQGHVYQIRSNSTDSLVVQAVDLLTQQAVITAKANLKDITDPLNPITLSGNLDLIATVTDRGEPGTGDTVAFTLWKNDTLWYASAWNGVQTVEQVLAGGNIQAHTNPQALVLDESLHVFLASIPEPLTLEQAGVLVEAAGVQWSQSGLVSEMSPEVLNTVEVRVANLPGSTLAWTLGSTIWLDADAAGQGWFIDPTPFNNEEFVPNSTLSTRSSALDHAPWQLVARPGSVAYGRVDLLTTVLHEMGHVLGYGDQAATNQAQTTLMTETLPVGARRLPSDLDDGLSGSFGLSGCFGVSGSESSSAPNNSQLTIHNSTLGGGTASPRHPSLFTFHENLVGQLLRGSRSTFSGLWGVSGTGQGSSSRPDASVPRIEWGDDEEEGILHAPMMLKAASSKTSWLSRFLSYTGRAADHHEHGIEVVLPGKKK